jgi:hypothetical protein
MRATRAYLAVGFGAIGAPAGADAGAAIFFFTG